MKKVLLSFFAVALLLYVAPSAHAEDWVYLGQAHVDGQHDHDNIEVGAASGRYQAREKRLPVLPVTSRSEPLTPASFSSLRPNSHSRSDRRFT